MTRWVYCHFFVWAAVAVASTVCRADAPPLIPVQGFLTDTDGVPIDGAHRLTFGLHDAATGGGQLYTEDYASIDVVGGHFTVYLGSESALDLSSFRDNQSVWLEITIDGTEVISPRTELGSVPYAAYAQYCGNSWIAGGAESAIVSSFDVLAYSDCGGVDPVPHMEVFVNKALVAEFDIPAATSAAYTVNLPEPTYVHEIATAFSNDSQAGDCDHNLHVDAVQLDTGATIQASDAQRVIYDRGAYFDNADVLPGQTGVGQQGALRFFLAPQPAELEPEVQVFRYSVQDGADYGAAQTWTALDYVNFSARKFDDDTRLKITWTDSYRAHSPSGGGGCGWHIRLNGEQCGPNPLFHVQHDNSAAATSDIHHVATTVQVCENVPAGPVQITAFGARRDGDEDCYRGHAITLNPANGGDTFDAAIIVEEIR
ncbi:MAG: hypothetical protein OEZ06_00855 [Myxococcales bacterium]|nr:hypothetical protein [Myxococcales bacterium]